MNPTRNHKDLELISQLSHSASHLDSLPFQDLATIAEVFRLPLISKEERGRDVKRVLHEALVLQREHFSAYLQLPKFKLLSPRTLALVHAYCNYIWTAFVAHRQNQAQSHAAAIQVDHSSGVMAQSGKDGSRVNPFDYYRAYQYPKFGMEQPKVTYTPFPYYYNFQNYSYPQYPPQQQPPIVKLANNFYKETHADGEREHGLKEEREDRVDKGDRSEKGEKIQKVQKPDKRQKGEKGDKSEKGETLALKGIDSNSESRAKSSSKKQHELAKKQSQASKKQIQQVKQPQIPPSKIINLRFLQCACLGHPITTSQKSFQCHQCKNLFHYSCLHLSASDGKSCPFCTLTRHHAFTEAMPRTIKSGWFQIDHKECFVTKLHLDTDEFGTFKRYMGMLEKDKEGVHAIQFRILRINQKAKVRAGRKIIKTSFPLLPNQLRKIESRHWIELKLKQITQPSLIFYLMTMIKIKDRNRIQQDYKTLEQTKVPLAELWAEQERTSGKKLELSMVHPISKKIIELPVRGEHCEHLQCEDMLQLYEQFQRSAQQGNNLLLCSYCKKNYTAHSKFTADGALFALLQNRPEKAKKLKLQNGKAQWLVSESVSEAQLQEESISDMQS